MPFDVLSLPGLKSWHKADGVLWEDSARTAAATDDADPVGAWDDASGQSNHELQATAGFRPTLKLAIQNGLPVMRFDGTDDFLQATFGASISQPNTIFIVAKWASVRPSYWTDGAASGERHAIICGDQAAGSLDLYAGGAMTVSTHTGLTAVMKLYTVLFNGASSTAWLNGAAGSTVSPGSHALGGLTLGARFNGANPSAIDIGEIIVCNGDRSAERVNVEHYLNGKWGVYATKSLLVPQRIPPAIMAM